jgi:hypothetical protein
MPGSNPEMQTRLGRYSLSATAMIQFDSMNTIFHFGETIEGYPVSVLNERAVRAAAGILFFFALVSFMNAWLLGNFEPTRVFVVAFLIDFVIRIFINPKYAPSLIAGQFMVRRQTPEYVGAPQKRFAWAIGLVLALTVFWLVVVQRVIGPANLLVCSTCLLLLFFESAFGICIGCKIYNVFHKEQAQLCPGAACLPHEMPPQHRLGFAHASVFGLFLVVIYAVAPFVTTQLREAAMPQAATAAPQQATSSEEERCKVPDFAIAMGHAEKWKLHNNCK